MPPNPTQAKPLGSNSSLATMGKKASIHLGVGFSSGKLLVDSFLFSVLPEPLYRQEGY